MSLLIIVLNNSLYFSVLFPYTFLYHPFPSASTYPKFNQNPIFSED